MYYMVSVANGNSLQSDKDVCLATQYPCSGSSTADTFIRARIFRRGTVRRKKKVLAVGRLG